MLIALMSLSLSAQSNSKPKVQLFVAGVVVDEAGEPLPGASVVVKGTSHGAAADVDGRFRIKITAPKPVLVVNYVGMKSEEVRPSAQNMNNLRIVMHPLSEELSEVVVTGYQEVKKEKMTGAVTTLSAEKLADRYSANVLDNLEGRVAGLSTYGGKPVIRGLGTLHGKTAPLVVIDGVPVESTLSGYDPFKGGSSDAAASALSEINPYDIESINVLKDAAAAAIYGARAANGIIVVTTKKARTKGRIEVDGSANISIYERTNTDYADNFLMTPSQQVDAESKFYEYYFFGGEITNPISIVNTQINNGNSGISPIKYNYLQLAKGAITRDQLNATLDKLRTNNFARDYADKFISNQVIEQYNLAVRSSADKFRNNLTLNYKTEDEGFAYNSNDWLNMSFRGSYDLTPWLTANLSFNGIYSTRNSSGLDLSANYTNPFFFPGYTPFYNEDGSPAKLYYLYSGNEYWNSANKPGFYDLGVNISDELTTNTQNSRRSNMRYHADLLFKIVKGLTLNTQFLYETENHTATWHALESSHVARTIRNAYTLGNTATPTYQTPEHGGMLRTTNTFGNYWTARAQANYTANFLDRHDLSVITGLEFRQTKINGTQSLALGYIEQLQNSATHTVDFGKLGNFRENPTYMTGIGGFPAAAAAWPYIGDAMGLYVEKLHRYASGYANMTYTYNQRYNLFGSFRKDYADVYGLNAKFRGKPLWSVGAAWNIHNEEFMRNYTTWLNFMKLRASYGATGNIYQGATSYMTATSTELNKFTYLPMGEVKSPANPNLRWEENRTLNAGVDFSLLDYRMRGSLDFYNKESRDVFNNKALDPTTGFTTMFANVASLLNRGVELSLAYDWLTPGRNKPFGWTTELTWAYNRNQVTKVENPAPTAAALVGLPFKEGYPVNTLWSYRFAGVSSEKGYEGMTMWYNQDNQQVRRVSTLKPEVLEFSGQTDPTTTVGLTNTLRWKGLTLNVKMAYCGGHVMRALAESEMSQLIPYAPIPSYYNNSWTPENPTSTPGFGQYGNTTPASECMASNASVYDASFLKVRNVVLSYDVPVAAIKMIGLKGLALSVQYNNPKALWVANSRGIDPETLGVRQRSSCVVGLNVKF